MAGATERPQWQQWRMDVDAAMAMKTTTINQRRGRWMARWLWTAMAGATEGPQWQQWRMDVNAAMAMKTTTII